MSFFKKKDQKETAQNIWARPGMAVIFRAEVMPGKNREERTFRITEVLRNGRVKLHDFAGEHRENEFEAINFKR